MRLTINKVSDYVRKTSAVFLLLLFLFPTIVRDFHRHHHFFCNAGKEKHIHDYHPNCELCKYEFLTLHSKFNDSAIGKVCYTDKYFSFYRSQNIILRAPLSFSLRAPPFAG